VCAQSAEGFQLYPCLWDDYFGLNVVAQTHGPIRQEIRQRGAR